MARVCYQHGYPAPLIQRCFFANPILPLARTPLKRPTKKNYLPNKDEMSKPSKKLVAVAPLVADHHQWNSRTWQNPPNPGTTVVTFETIMQQKKF